MEAGEEIIQQMFLIYLKLPINLEHQEKNFLPPMLIRKINMEYQNTKNKIYIYLYMILINLY